MASRVKLLTSLSVIAMTGALAASCGGEGEGTEGSADSSHSAAMAEGEGESEGEGAVAEGEGAGALIEDDKTAFLSGLLMIEGHLRAGTALFDAGDLEMAATHMKHPQDEIYARLQPAFAAYDHPGFADDLETLAALVTGGASQDDVHAAFDKIRENVREAIAVAKPSTRETLLAAVATLNTAGEEFDLAVDDGKIVNAHEYQDAHGFITAVSSLISGLDSDNEVEKAALDLAREQVGLALATVPSTSVPKVVTAQASTIYGAAARIEIAALGL